jgi:hypothetical protein
VTGNGHVSGRVGAELITSVGCIICYMVCLQEGTQFIAKWFCIGG